MGFYTLKLWRYTRLKSCIDHTIFIFYAMTQLLDVDVDIPDRGPPDSLEWSPQVPQLQATSSGRRRKFPRHFKDHLPSLSFQVPHMPAPVPRAPPVPPVHITEPENEPEPHPEPLEPTRFETE